MKKYYKKIWPYVFLRLIFYIIYISAIAALPFIIKEMIDCGFKEGIYDVCKWIAIFGLLVVIGMLAQYVTQKSAWRLDRGFYKSIRHDYFSKIIQKLPDEYANKQEGQYISEILNDISCAEEYIEYTMQIIESAIGLIIYALYIFLLDYRIAVLLYIIAILVLFLPQITGKKLSTKKTELLINTGEYTNQTLDLFKGFLFVDKFTFNAILNRHRNMLSKLEDSRYNYGSYKTYANVLNGSVMYIINTSAFAIIAILLYYGNITVGIAAATMSYVQDFMYPLRSVVDSINSLKSVAGVKRKIIEELDTEGKRNFNERSVIEKIELKGISYSREECIIKDYSYIFEKGKKYVIIGENGSGKSTLLRLIMGMFKVDEGTILINDGELDYNICNSQIYYLPQDVDVYDASFHDNVTMFDSYYEKQDFYKYFDIFHLRDKLKSEKCTDLSGGEKQLLLLMRGIMSGKQILILDEPFSALSGEKEVKLTKLINQMPYTIIMVTHNRDKEYLSLFDEIISL